MCVIDKIRLSIREDRLISSNEHGLVAVSGGPDSVAMLHILSNVIGPELGLRITAVHLNHKLRGKNADSDAEFVNDICRQWGISLHCESRDVAASKPPGESMENWARKIRYELFKEVRAKLGCSWTATGHTQSDQIETVLMRLISGAGICGLRGILPFRPDGIIRPLLAVSRQEVDSYLQNHNIPFRIDETNADLRFLRNRVRHDILPRLIEKKPDFELELLNLSSHARRTWADLSKKVAIEAGKVIRADKKGHFILDLKGSLSYPNYVIRDFLAKIVERPVRAHIAALKELCGKQPGKSIKVPGFRIWRTAEGLLVLPNSVEKPSSGIEVGLGTLIANEEEGLTIGSALADDPPAYPPAAASEAYFDADAVGDAWTIRPWREGDRFSPLGLGGRQKKISDLLCENKVPVPKRRDIFVMETLHGIAWVIGHRIGEPFRVRADSKRIVRVYFERSLHKNGAQQKEQSTL